MITEEFVRDKIYMFIDFHRSVYNELISNSDKFKGVVYQEDEDAIIFCEGHSIAINRNGNLEMLSPFYYPHSGSVSNPDFHVLLSILLEKFYILRFGSTEIKLAELPKKICTYDPEDYLIEKIIKLITATSNKLFEDIAEELIAPAIVKCMKSLYIFSNLMGMTDAQIGAIKDDNPPSIFIKLLFEEVIYNNNIQEIISDQEE